jgi:hypothetical protein
MPKSSNSEKIHLRVGQRNLRKFPTKSSHKGWIKNAFWLAGEGPCEFESPNGDNGMPKWNGPRKIAGCGILLDPQNKLSIFFTLNGILIGKLLLWWIAIELCSFAGKKMPISPSLAFLYPTIEISHVSVEANFGNDPAKPFAYSIEKCPGMGYD